MEHKSYQDLDVRNALLSRTDNLIHPLLKRHPHLTASQTRSELGFLSPLTCEDTIHRRLRVKLNLRSDWPANCCQERTFDSVRNCWKYRSWWFQDWSKVMFSNETTTVRQLSKNGFRDWRPSENGILWNIFVTRVKHPLQIMIWPSISAKRTRCSVIHTSWNNNERHSLSYYPQRKASHAHEISFASLFPTGRCSVPFMR